MAIWSSIIISLGCVVPGSEYSAEVTTVEFCPLEYWAGGKFIGITFCWLTKEFCAMFCWFGKPC
jgi:hypothetical protein